MVAHDMHALGADEERSLVRLRVIEADGSARLEEICHEALIDDVDPHDPRRAGEDCVRAILIAEVDVEGDVSRARRAGAEPNPAAAPLSSRRPRAAAPT